LFEFLLIFNKVYIGLAKTNLELVDLLLNLINRKKIVFNNYIENPRKKINSQNKKYRKANIGYQQIAGIPVKNDILGINQHIN
jgi:hypothetical protein